MLRVTWIGQAGLLFKSHDRTILIDPYLSDSVAGLDPAKTRKIPPDPALWQVKPDVIIFTHDHLDHFDPETAGHWLGEKGSIRVLAPSSVWQKVRKYGWDHNYILFDPGTQWTDGGLRFTAVPAAHSDPHAIGVLLQEGGKQHYVTGDTLYSTRVLSALPDDIDTVFLPINGVGNNMNIVDAARFAADCGARTAVPLHYGLFDNLNGEDFPFENKRILQVYREEIL